MPGANWHRDTTWVVEEGSGVGTVVDPRGLFWSDAGSPALYVAGFGEDRGRERGGPGRGRGGRFARVRRGSGPRQGHPLPEAQVKRALLLAFAIGAAVPVRAADHPPTAVPFAPQQVNVDSIRYAVRVTDNNLVGVTTRNYGFIR